MKQAKRLIGFDKSVKTSVIGLFIVISLFVFGSVRVINAQNGINYQISEINIKNPSSFQSESIIGTITAYNVGDISQNDSDACISAHNIDICQLVDQGVSIVANNCLPENTEVEIAGLGRFVVLDRKNSRYGCEWFDIAMPQDKVVDAIQFGIQTRNIIIYK